MLKGKPVVLLDCDDVVLRCAHKMLREVNTRLGTRYTEEDLTSTWDLFGNLNHPEHPDLKQFVEDKMREPGWCLDLDPFPGAVDGVAKLQKMAEVFFITSPFRQAPHWEYERRENLRKNFGISTDRVLQGSAKFLVRGDVFVDDKPDHCNEWSSYSSEGTAFLWDRPHNGYYQGLLRLRSWEELHDFVGTKGSNS